MRYYLLLLLMACTVGLKAQTDSLPLYGVIGSNITDFIVDNLGNVLLVGSEGQLKKLNAKGDSVAVFNDVRRYGKLYSMDVSNPLKVLLFYKDFGTIVVLDRFLNIRNTIDVRQLNIMQAKAIGQSFDNGTWIYDELDGKLKRIDDNGRIVSESNDFRRVFDEPPSPEFIMDADRLVYLYDPNKGLFVMDYYSNLRNKVALLDWIDVQVIGKRVLGRKGTTLYSYEPGTLSLKEQALPSTLKGVVKTHIERDQLYCLKNGTLFIYSLSNQ